MAENVMNCPICGSELFISEKAIYCSNPKCNYVSNIAPTYRAYKKDHLTILLPFAFLIIAIGLILIFITMIFFTATVFFLFIPLIFPIPILRKLFKRRKINSIHKSEA
ncbi:MAG: hypothetical protein H3Z52_02105 [archaeon]|nr:hypothetical protein [archaeon]MCP8318148.1 hypothetical protein [archaeon]MCP8319722.1 hypothetical protein [archaeon]